MIIPGNNLLNLAFSVISKTTVTYRAFNGRTTNALGLQIDNAYTDSQVQGSLQPIQRSRYQELGLDLQKTYYMFYVSRAVIDVARDVSSDRIVFQSKTYQCISKTDWFAIDGWTSVICELVS